MENTALLIAIIKNAIDGIFIIDEKGIIELINPAACSLFDYQPEEVIGKSIKMLMPNPDRDQHDAYLMQYKATGKAHIIGVGRDVIGASERWNSFSIPFRIERSTILRSPDNRVCKPDFV